MSDDVPGLEPIDVSEPGPPAVPTEPGGPTAPGGDAWPGGWYADPWTAGQYRFWNGHAWTGETHRSGPATPTSGPSAWPASPPLRDSSGLSASGAPIRLGPPGSGSPPSAPIGPSAPHGTPRGRTAAWIAGLVVLALLSGAVGYAIESHSRSKGSAASNSPATTPTTAAPGPSTSAPGAAERTILSRIVVQQRDVAGSREVVLLQDGNRLTQPTLDLCNGAFSSEKLRVARLQVADVDPTGNATLSTEAVVYRNASATQLAFTQLRKVAAACPHAPVKSPVGEVTAETQFNAPPDKSWPNTPSVQRLAYSFVTTEAGTKSPSIAVYLRRGRVLLGVYFPNPSGAQPPVAGQTSVEGIVGVFEARMAQLPASVVNAGS